MNNKKILVVGGAGFVGSNLVNKLLDYDGINITIVDNLLSADISNVPKKDNVIFILGSITDDNILYCLPKDFDYIFHLATYHGNQSSIDNPLCDHENNTLTTLKICEYFKNSPNLTRLVYASAGCVVAEKTYDQPEATSEDSNISLYLDSPYQMSKIFGEFYGNYYFKKHNLPFVKARFQNIYGPNEILGAGEWRGNSSTVWRNVIPTFIWKALHDEELNLDNNGETTRDFIFVDDIANGLIGCALNGQNGNVYNLATGIETSIGNLAKIIIKYTKSKSKLNLLPKRDWDNSGRRYGDPDKSKKELNFDFQYNLEEGIKKTVEWTIQNKQMIKNNINKHSFYSNINY